MRPGAGAGPRGVSADVVTRINAEVNKVLQSPEMVERFRRMGIEAGRGSAADFGAMVAADTARWSKVVAERKIKVEQ